MTAALESRTDRLVSWTVPTNPLPGVTWYEPGELFNPDSGNPVLFTM